MASIKQTFTAPGQSTVVPTPNAIYFATFAGTSFSAVLAGQYNATEPTERARRTFAGP